MTNHEFNMYNDVYVDSRHLTMNSSYNLELENIRSASVGLALKYIQTIIR